MLTPFNDIWKNKSEGCSVAFKAINQSLVIRKISLLPYSHNIGLVHNDLYVTIRTIM
jgi:hypothetical protein